MHDMVQCNDLVNDFNSILIESAEKSVPIHLYNPRVIDTNALKTKGRTVGEFMPAKADFGGNLREAFADFQPAKIDPGMINYAGQLVDQHREITGILRPIFGGDEGRQTAREAELKRNQALMGISIPWHASRRLIRRGNRNLVLQVAKYSGGFLYLPTGASGCGPWPSRTRQAPSSLGIPWSRRSRPGSPGA